jgi:hypothetical protein
MVTLSPGSHATTTHRRGLPSSVSAPWPRVPLLETPTSYPRDELFVAVKASIH